MQNLQNMTGCKEEKNFKCLSGLLPEDILEFCNLKEKFRSIQIFEWIAKGSGLFDNMQNLPVSLRKYLNDNFFIYSSKINRILKDPDGTIKLAIELYDGAKIETVLLFDRNGRKTACVSCQAGCPLKCAFCKTGTLGFLRNLSAGEIVEQFFYLENNAGKLDNIVFMGMGEPMLNLTEIKKAIEILTHPKGKNLSKRRITISTAGVCSGIYKMADTGPNVRLAVSLTAANQELREKLMPIAKANPLPALKTAIRYFNEKSSKRVTLEFALMKNINTSYQSAKEIIEFAKGLNCHLNLIPWNPIEELKFEPPSLNEVKRFAAYLENKNLNITIRQKHGQTIGGACGQLGSISGR